MNAWGGLAVTVHDAAAAVVSRDGTLRMAAEERFGGPKRAGGWPGRALAWVRGASGDPVRWGVSWRPWAGLLARAGHGLPSLSAPRAGLLLAQALAPVRAGLPVRWLAHHRCHAAAAFWTSPFERAAVLVVDAAGEGWSSWAGIGEGWRLTRLDRTPYPHSLGFLYAGITEYLGWEPDRDEGTVMGLAALGDPPERLREAVRSMVHPEGPGVRLDLAAFAHHRRTRPILSEEGVRRLGVPRRAAGAPVEPVHADLAAALQAHTEAVLVAMARALHARTGLDALCLGGGVALNGPAVEAVRRESGFSEVFVPPFPHDAGTAVGAALLLAAADGGVDREALRRGVTACGPGIGREAARRALRAAGLDWTEPDDPEEAVAAALAEGAVVARARGRAEPGPRALGRRSLLADPRDAGVRDRLNRMKGREAFRPVAPVMTVRAAKRFLDTRGGVPYMERAVAVRPAAADGIPAVVHADGTARAQTVRPEDDAALHRLLVRFGAIAGVEVLCNTSLNGPGEPMALDAPDAVRTAVRLGADLLDLDGLLARL